jgi:uncharacterized protein
MLIEFRAENFGSIKGEQILSLVASNYYKDLPGNTFQPGLPGLSGTSLLKGVALYGPNASGKSTVIKAMRRLQSLVTGSASKETSTPLPFHPFCLDTESCKSPTKFFVAFVASGVRYEYRVSYVAERVLHEALSAFPSGKEQVWFERTWLDEEAGYRWRRPGALKVTSELVGMVRENVLFVSLGAQLNNSQLRTVYDWFEHSLKIVNLGPDAEGLGTAFSTGLIKDGSDLRGRFLELLAHADLGVVGATVQQASATKTTKMMEDLGRFLQPAALEELMKMTKDLETVALEHQASGAVVPIELSDESAGTQRLFALGGPWLDILQHGYTAFIDELDASLHPVLLQQLLALLFSEGGNPNGAQVVFTTHNPYLLGSSVLRRDQVWFTEKDSTGASHLYPLTEYKPRPKESVINGYLSGRYGAVPMIPAALGLQ